MHRKIREVREIREIDQFKKIIKDDKTSVIAFWATWSGPCTVISPIYQKLSEEEEFSGIEFYKIDIDKATHLAQAVGIQSMPTFKAYKSGNIVNTIVGALPSQLETFISELVA